MIETNATECRLEQIDTPGTAIRSAKQPPPVAAIRLR